MLFKKLRFRLKLFGFALLGVGVGVYKGIRYAPLLATNKEANYNGTCDFSGLKTRKDWVLFSFNLAKGFICNPIKFAILYSKTALLGRVYDKNGKALVKMIREDPISRCKLRECFIEKDSYTMIFKKETKLDRELGVKIIAGHANLLGEFRTFRLKREYNIDSGELVGTDLNVSWKEELESQKMRYLSEIDSYKRKPLLRKLSEKGKQKCINSGNSIVKCAIM